MVSSSLPPRITSFLVKIASRCNLACDYCYIYEHADQSWRSQPPFMSDQTRRKLAERIINDFSDALAGAAKDQCVMGAKARFGKS